MSQEPYQFVISSVRSDEERIRNSQLARAHAARVNRQKRKSQVRHSSEKHESVKKSSSSKAKPSSTPLSTKAPIAKSDENHKSAEPPELRSEVWSNELAGSRGAVSGTGSEAQSVADDSVTVAASPRTISPVFGAVATRTSDLNSSRSSASLDYCLKVLWPNALMDQGFSRQWLETFCQHPMLFHAMHFAVATHHDVLCNKISWTASRETLMHKTMTIKHLNAALPKIGDSNIDTAIMAVMILATSDLQDQHLATELVLPFNPHMPGSQWLSVYGRLELVDAHLKALFRLSQIRGGLHKIQIPGLGQILAFADLYSSSRQYTKPAFPRFWDVSVPDFLSKFPTLFLQPSIGRNAGRGFRDWIPGGLPNEALFVYRNLALVDHLMSQCRLRQLADEETHMLVDVRNTAQHRLLSLPSWENLDEDDREGLKRSTYECCWLTALLYSNSIIFPLPLHIGWNVRLVSKLQYLLENSNLDEWEQDVSALLVWSLVVGGIASSWTPSRKWFEHALKRRLVRSRLTSKHVLREVIGEFLWTDSACGRGAESLWDALALDRHDLAVR